MTSILVVCTGNICRSPIAEGMLRAALLARLGDAAPRVSSVGTAGVEGSGPTPEAIEAARERGVDIGAHVARRLRDEAADADLVITMAREHREMIASDPELADRTFTLKELVRLLESLPPASTAVAPDSLAERAAAAADARRAGARANPLDEDVVDPIGGPLHTYRAVAWEIEEWVSRLVDGLYGAPTMRAAGHA